MKKVVSLLLALCLLVGCFPLAASATGVTITQVIPYKYDIFANGGDFSEGLASVSLNGKHGFIDKTGKAVIPFKYDATGSFSEGLASVCRNGKWGVIDKTGKEIVPCKYDYVEDFSEGLARVEVNDQGVWMSGYINKTGKEVIPCRYGFASSFSDGLAAMGLIDEDGYVGKVGFVDKTGKEVIPFQYDYAESFSEDLAVVCNRRYGYGFIDKTGQEVIPCKYDDAVSFSGGLAKVKLDDKWSFIDKTGREVIPYKYSYMADFSEGLAAVELNDKWGFIDKTGQEVVPCKYGGAASFSEGLATVCNDRGKHGFIDKTGKEVIPFKYDGTGAFSEGFVSVKLNGKWGYISLGGGTTIPTKPTVAGFTDVYEGEYYSDAVVWAVDKNITSGTDKNHFSPNVSCTRAQAVTFLWRAAGEPEPAGTAASFKDVKAGSYYEKAVQWAVEQNITGGTGNGKFSPETACSRAQIVTFLWRKEGSPETSGSAFSDVKTGEYYETAVKWAVANEITGGTGNGKFSPDARCARGQIVTFLYRYAN